MDKETAARLAAKAKERSAAALQTPNPSTLTGREAVAAKETAKRVAKQSPTGGTAPGGYSDAEAHGGAEGGVLAWLKDKITGVTGGAPTIEDAAGEFSSVGRDPLTGAPSATAASMLAAPAQGLLGVLDTLRNRDERTGEVAPLTTAATTMTDSASLGTLSKVQAVADTLENGANPDYAGALVARQLEQEYIRAANPMSAFAGDVAGSIGVGSVLMGAGLSGLKAIGSVPQTWFKRTIFGSGVAGGEAFTYRMNKDGDLARATVDASVAFLGGTAISALGKMGGGVLNLFKKPKVTEAMKEDVGNEIIKFINIDRQKAGLPPATTVEVQKTLAELGPDATLMDMSPNLRLLGQSVLRNESDELTGAPLRELIASRNGLVEGLMAPDGGLRKILLAEGTQGFKPFTKLVQGQMKALQPTYTAILSAHKDARFSAKTLVNELGNVFGDVKRMTSNQADLMGAVMGRLRDAQSRLPKGQKTQFTLEQLLDINRGLAGDASKKALRIAGTDKTLPLDNATLRDLTKVREYFASKMEAVAPELGPINAVYGNFAGLRTAYKAGAQMITAPGQTGDDIAAFLMDNTKSFGSHVAFLEGAKHRLFTKLSSVTTSDSLDKALLENKPMLDRLAGLIGEDAVSDMVKAVKPLVEKARTAEMLAKVDPKIAGQTAANQMPGVIADLAVGTAGGIGSASQAAGLGAGKRLLQKVTGGTNPQADPLRQQLTADILSKMGNNASDTFKQLEALTTRQISPNQVSGIRNTMAAGLVGKEAFPNFNDSDGQVP